jgi:putative transposase
VAVAARNTRWCSDGLEIAAENGERVRVAFALDCCDREAMSFVATTAGISGEDVRDLMVAAVEHRFGRVNRLPGTIEWLTDIACPGLDPGAAVIWRARPAASLARSA